MQSQVAGGWVDDDELDVDPRSTDEQSEEDATAKERLAVFWGSVSNEI